jgi:SPP1 family predicted phage head-tail adaptor
MIDPGKLNRRLLLEAPAITPDGAGGVIRTFQTLTLLWAALTPVSARPGMAADGAGATVTHRITIRSGPEVTTRHRFRLGARVFQIIAVRDQDGQSRFLDIDVAERTD